MLTRIVGLAASVATTFLVTTMAFADERIGRYQAVPLADRADILSQDVMILDTQTGALYLWVRAFPTKDSPSFTAIVFQGNLIPGTKPGELVARAGGGLPVVQLSPRDQRDPLGILKPK